MTAFLSDILAIVEAKSWDETPNVNKLYLATFGGVYNARPITQSTASQNTTPTGIFFKPDGTKMYEIDSGNFIYESDLPTPWDISTRVFLQSIATQDSDSMGIFFKPDGTKMYEIGFGSHLIYEFDLSTPWDISTRVFLQSIATQGSSAQGIFFKPDGTKMYEVDDASDLIYESDLSTPWDISTRVFLQSVATQDTLPKDIFFKPDGTTMYEIGTGRDLIYESDLSTPWDISTATFIRLTRTMNVNPSGIFFKSDGTKIYEVDSAAALIYESDLYPPWNIDTFVKIVTTQGTVPSGLFFKPDGTKMYEVDITSNLIYESDLSTPWDISTRVFLQSIATQSASTNGIFFKPDGTKMYEVASGTSDLIYESDLSTPWDISTRVFLQSIATQDINPTGIFFKPDGTKMYESDNLAGLIYESDLSTPWDISTRVFLQSVAAQGPAIHDIFIKPDGTKIYEVDTSSDLVYESDLTTPWDISTKVFVQSSAAQDASVSGIFFKPDGVYMYQVGITSDLVYQIELMNAWNILDQTKCYAARLTSSAVFESKINVVFWGSQTVDPDFGFIDIGVADQNADIIDFAKKVTIADVSFYRVRANGTIRQLALAQTSEIAFADEDTIRLRLVSRLSKAFDLPINEFFYDSSIPDLEGKPYPILWGPGADSDINEARQMAPTLLVATGTTPTYHFTDLDAIDLNDVDQAPMDQGLALGLSQFSIVDNGFALDASAEGKITFFQPSGGGVVDPNDGARLVGLFRFLRLVAQRTEVYDYLFIPTLLELDAIFPESDFPQFQTFDVVKLRDFMSVLFDSFAGYFYTDFNGIIQYGQLQAPESQVATFTFTDTNTTGTIQVNDDTAPNLSDRITYGQNWGALSDADLAADLNDSEFRRARTLAHYEKKTTETIIPFYQSARAKPALKWAGRYAVDSDGPGALPLEELTRWWTTLYHKRRRFFTFQSQLTEENATLSIGDIIRLQSDTFGLLNTAVSLMINRLRFDFGSEILTVEAWGGQPSLLLPVATDVTFTGVLEVGATLTMSYAYSDPNGLPEYGTTYQWYRGESEDGSDMEAISGATSLTYEAQSEDFFLYLFSSAAPSNGYEVGTQAFSAGQLVSWIEGVAGAFYDSSLDSVLWKDYAGTLATTPGDAVQIRVDVLSLGRQKFGFSTGATTSVVSIPDQAAYPTGDMILTFHGALFTVASGALQALNAKYTVSGDQRSALLYLNATGRPDISTSSTGANDVSNLATASLTTVVSPGQFFHFRAKLDVDDGAGNRVATYEYSLQPASTAYADITWIQFEVVTTAGITSIFNSTSLVTVAADGSNQFRAACKFTDARVYSGITSPTLVSSMDAASYPGSGSTYTCSTGQTVTLAGQTFIAGDGYHAVAPSDAARMQLARMPYGGRRNLLERTQEFDNAYWTQSRLTVSANSTAAPDGTSTADTLVEDATAANSHRIFRASYTTDASAWTLSAYAKPNGRNWIYFRLTDSGTTERFVWFNVSTGAVGTTGTGFTASISSAGNGWYRCVATLSALVAGSASVLIGLSNADNATDYDGDGASGVFIWGAQLERAASASTYQTVTAAYDTTESGVPSVTWLYGNGTQYYSILGSRNLTCMHDGTGGFAAMNVYVNKVDDGADDAFARSIDDANGVGISFALLDGGANSGILALRIANGGGSYIVAATSAGSAVPRFEPATLACSYLTADTPDADEKVNGVSVATANQTGSPSASAATNDIRIFADPAASIILPGYLGSFLAGAITDSTHQVRVTAWFTRQSG